MDHLNSNLLANSAVEGMELKMAERSSATVSRRSTRLFVEEQDNMERGNAGQILSESRYGPSGDEKEKEKPQRDEKTSLTSNTAAGILPTVNLGKDIGGIFPTTVEDMAKHVTESLQAAKASTTKIDGHPANFGVVIPGLIYRSSFPQTEDFEFLGTLGLKTVVCLVKKDFPNKYEEFISDEGIRHCVIDMQGTKKVEISQAIMNSIIEIVLDKENYPVLIHCNQGRHRTGCATAVIRHISGWSADAIVEEYQGYAEPKIRDCDVKYISEYQVSSLRGLFDRKRRIKDRPPVLTRSKMARILVTSAVVLSIWITTAMFWDRA